MKKVLLTALLLSFTTGIASANYGYLGPTTESNRNFQPLMKHQFEREETLDFEKDPEHYKEKRENHNLEQIKVCLNKYTILMRRYDFYKRCLLASGFEQKDKETFD